jgi:hypothetical protein
MFIVLEVPPFITPFSKKNNHRITGVFNTKLTYIKVMGVNVCKRQAQLLFLNDVIPDKFFLSFVKLKTHYILFFIFVASLRNTKNGAMTLKTMTLMEMAFSIMTLSMTIKNDKTRN